MNLENDIAMGIRFLTDGIHQELFETPQYNRIFPRTNEALYLYYPYFLLYDASVLTVSGSGDHVLQAIKMGAREITAFDKNYFAYYYLYLKLGAVNSLSYDEFCAFFGFGPQARRKDIFFSKKTYEKVRPYLKDDILTFWDSLYQRGDFACNYNNLFYSDGVTSNLGKYSYLEERSYPLLKEKIKNVKIKYLSEDLLDLPKVLTKEQQYDTIFLSNIFDWLVQEDTIFNYREGNPKGFETFIHEELSLFLKEDGKCAIYTPLCSFFKTLAEDYLDSPYFSCGERNRVPKRVYVYTKK